MAKLPLEEKNPAFETLANQLCLVDAFYRGRHQAALDTLYLLGNYHSVPLSLYNGTEKYLPETLLHLLQDAADNEILLALQVYLHSQRLRSIHRIECLSTKTTGYDLYARDFLERFGKAKTLTEACRSGRLDMLRRTQRHLTSRRFSNQALQGYPSEKFAHKWRSEARESYNLADHFELTLSVYSECVGITVFTLNELLADLIQTGCLQSVTAHYRDWHYLQLRSPEHGNIAFKAGMGPSYRQSLIDHQRRARPYIQQL
jgi:hypothetical protein